MTDSFREIIQKQSLEAAIKHFEQYPTLEEFRKRFVKENPVRFVDESKKVKLKERNNA